MKIIEICSKYSRLLAYAVVLCVIALPLFGHLDEAPIQVWDELRGAQNALEMNNTGNIIVTTFDYKPETWNTKPPLMIWVLALSQRILGYNEIAVRLPSAIAAAFTCLLLLQFAKRHTGRYLPGIIAVIILVTAKGYVMMHGARTGDYDALLTFFTTASFCWLVNYLENENRRRWLFASTAALTAAVLTKGIAGFFILPAMFLYVLYSRKALLLIRQKSFYACLGFMVCIVCGYYCLRDLQQPGYFDLVLKNELGGRYNTTIENNGGDFRTYYNELADAAFVPWIWWFLPAVLCSIFSKDLRIQRLGLISILPTITILLIISFGSTKHFHYMVPVFPFISLFTAIPIFLFMELLRRWTLPQQILTVNFIPVLFLIYISQAPFNMILKETISGKYNKLGTGINDAGVYFKELISGKRPLNANVICGDAYPLFWYKSVINQKGGNITEVQKDALKVGMRVITWEPEPKAAIEQNFTFKEVERYKNVVIYLIEAENPKK